MTKTGIATLALLASAGIATAGEPMEITEVQLDYLTASSGGGIFNTGSIVIIDSTIGLGDVSMTMGDGSVQFRSGSVNLLVSPSPGTTARPAEFVVINVGQNSLELPPLQR